MTYQLLIACMNQTDYSIIEKSNIQCDAIIVNQCDEDSIKEFVIQPKESSRCYTVKWINSTSRGLSNSRNLAIRCATADICMIADDDQLFDDGLENSVITEYGEQPNSDVLIFGARYKKKQISAHYKRLKFVDLMKVSSVQITFRRESVLEKIAFDTKLGAGTPNGAGEENKFLLDCRKSGLTINFTPVTLFSMRDTGTPSTWLHGFNEDFFYKRGMVARYTYGFWFTMLYLPYYIVSHRKRLDCSLWNAMQTSLRGCFENKLSK